MKDKLKSLTKDTMIYGLLMIAGRFLTFTLTLFYTQDLQPSELGDLSSVLAIVAFMGILATFGMESAFFRFWDKDNPNESRRVFSNAYISIAATSLFLSLILYMFSGIIASWFTTESYGLPMIQYASWIPFLDSLMLIPYAYLRLSDNAKLFTLTRFSIIVLAVGLSLYFVIVLKHGPAGALKAQFISSIAGALILSYQLYKNKLFKYDFKLYKEMLIFGLPTIPASLSAIVLQISDQPLIKFLVGGQNGSEQTGIYSINYKLGIPMMLFVSMFEYAWKPFYLNNRKEKNAKELFARVLTYFTLIASFLFLFITLFVDFIVKIPIATHKTLINSNYWEALNIVPIILIAYYFNGIFTNLTASFYITKKTKYLPISIGIAAAFNIVSNIIFIPIYGYIAAAYNTLFAYIISAGVLYYFQKGIYKIEYEWGRIIKICASTSIVLLIDFVCNSFTELIYNLTFKLAMMILHLVLLKLLGFYTKSEIAEIKKYTTK